MSETFTTSDGREVTAEDQRRMAEKIGKLIAMAEDEANTDAARASYAEKAETLMREYRINEENVISTGEASVLPVRFDITLITGSSQWFVSNFESSYVRIWREISNHAGLKSHVRYVYDENGNRAAVASGFGYEIDVRLAQFLWTAAHLTFATRIDTKVDRSLSDQLNCYYMRGSGQERADVANLLWGSDLKDGAAHGKVQKLYLAECTARGEVPSVGGKGFRAERYRKAYAEGFVDQFGWRLRDARSAVDAQSGGIVLHGRDDRVAEAYYTEFPTRRPKTAEEQAEESAKAAAFWAAQDEEEKLCRERGACSKTKHGCKKHRAHEVTETERKRWEREATAPERTAGRRAGAAAASSVEFRRTAADRTQKAPRGTDRTALEG